MPTEKQNHQQVPYDYSVKRLLSPETGNNCAGKIYLPYNSGNRVTDHFVLMNV